jgi:hypothetical protein
MTIPESVTMSSLPAAMRVSPHAFMIWRTRQERPDQRHAPASGMFR